MFRVRDPTFKFFEFREGKVQLRTMLLYTNLLGVKG